MSDLFLAEHDFQVKDFIRRGFRNSGDWITLGPSAMMALDNEKIPYRIPEDFFMPEDLESACLKSHERVEFLSERLDQLAVEKYTELRDYGIRPFLFSIFPLTIIFDALVSRIFILKAILEANNNCRIFIHSNTSSSFGFFEIAFTMEDTLWGQVLSLAGWDREIEVLPDPIKSKDNALFHSILDRFSVDAMQRILKSAYFCKVRKKKSILIKGDDMWHYVEHSLKDKGWRIIRGLGVIKNAELPGRERPSVVDSIKSNPELMDYFGYRGICFFSLIEKRLLMLESLAAGSPSRILARLHSLIEGSGLIGILISSSATFTDQAINQLAKYLGLPVINWQHGFIYYDQSISQLSEYKELMGSKVLFTYGQEVTRGFNHYLDKFPCKIYSVGSPAIEAIRKKPAALRRYTAKKKMHILYATSTYYQNYWYFGFSPPFSDRLFYQDQLIIIESLNKIALSYKHKITIKLHPLLHDQIFWINDLLHSRNIEIVRVKPFFSELILKADIILLDLPTTTILQAVATNKPVFVLTKHIRYPENMLSMLKKRAVCSPDARSLINELSDFLKTGHYKADQDNEDFLLSYGLGSDKGDSCDRAMEVIGGCIDNG